MGSIIVKNVKIPHGEVKLKGRVYRSCKSGKAASVMICHGYPGDTKNLDLAEELAFNGINVLVFYYMGAWGSEGTYRFRNLTPSAVSALDWLLAQEYADPSRVGLISHSMGAVPLTNLMSADDRVKTGVLMAPASDLSLWLSEDVVDTVAQVFISMAEGKLAIGATDEYVKDMVDAGSKLNPMNIADKIKAPLLVIVGSRDDVTKPATCEALYHKISSEKKWVLLDGADHSFTEHRIPLHKSILEWLNTHL